MYYTMTFDLVYILAVLSKIKCKLILMLLFILRLVIKYLII